MENTKIHKIMKKKENLKKSKKSDFFLKIILLVFQNMKKCFLLKSEIKKCQKSNKTKTSYYYVSFAI